ncbi:hypothetical protein M4D79_04150 [Mycolicibacterium novocastrense]|nr:hypothetical protein M4D79_04150 [Mycolicibacterium novocastrense]
MTVPPSKETVQAADADELRPRAAMTLTASRGRWRFRASYRRNDRVQLPEQRAGEQTGRR